MSTDTIHHSQKKKKDYSLYWKTGFISIITLLLMIPTTLIEELIYERMSYQDQTQHKIARSWGGHQTLAGPILTIPYTSEHVGSDNKTYTTEHTYFVTPESLNVNINLDSEIRQKSIYEAILYNCDASLEGSFNLSELRNVKGAIIKWDKAKVVMCISNPTSLTQQIDLTIGDTITPFKPGSVYPQTLHKGIHANIAIKDQDVLNFKTSFNIRGNHHLYFEPAAKNSTVDMISDWSSPGFVGNKLADSKTITADGFTAQWNISEFNRTVPDYWSDMDYKIGQTNAYFGVDLINPVDHYQKNMRSAKYSLLIITLTFVTFFFFEVIKRKKVHPVQYSLIGAALILFYYLLLSFTEHIGFEYAYLIAASSIIILLLMYSFSVFKNLKSSLSLVTILTILYTYIYILLQLEEYALIAGSLGLFIILAAIMFLTRRVNWYKFHTPNIH